MSEVLYNEIPSLDLVGFTVHNPEERKKLWRSMAVGKSPNLLLTEVGLEK